MPPKKAAAPKAHASVSALTFYAGSAIVFVSAALSYALAQAGGDPLEVAVKMWLMNAGLCLVASWLTWDHSWRVPAAAPRLSFKPMRAPLRRERHPHPPAAPRATGWTGCGL